LDSYTKEREKDPFLGGEVVKKITILVMEILLEKCKKKN
jgi:hypothetical protein